MRLMKFVLLGFMLISIHSLFAETGMPAIQKAVKENKHLFIFFYKDQNARTLRAQGVFEQVGQKLGGQADFVKIAVNDPEEKQVVEKFDLKRSPMPFILVLAPNGAVTGGFPSTATEEQLTGSLSSPGMASCLKSLQAKKLVLLCVQNSATTDNEEALKGVRDFKSDHRYAGSTEIVMIDPSDVQEQKFLSQLNVDVHSTQSITVFLSPPAETIGQYKGATGKEQFATDLQKAVSGCCGPGGCGPGGCCPGGKCK